MQSLRKNGVPNVVIAGSPSFVFAMRVRNVLLAALPGTALWLPSLCD